MTSVTEANQPELAQLETARPEGRPAGGARFDLAMSLLLLWVTLGLFLDGWFHHAFPDSVETFFTPWHGVLYSGFFAVAGYLVYHQTRNMAAGRALRSALPDGYALSLAGVAVFLLGGVGDLIWHTLFGFEEGLELLLSPSHLTLAAGGVLLVAGPILSAWLRGNVDSRARLSFPTALSLMILLSLLTFFTEYANALYLPQLLVEDFGSYFELDVQRIASVLLPSILIVAVLMLALKRWALAPGHLTLILGGNAILMSFFHAPEVARYPQGLIAALITAGVAEALYAGLRPSDRSRTQLRVFAFAVPFVMFSTFFILLLTTVGIRWSIHMWTGSILQAGAAGVFMSVLVFPPQQKAAQAPEEASL